MKTARDLGPVNPEANGEQRLYKLRPAIKYSSYEDGEEVTKTAKFVVVSMCSRAETFIFPSDKAGVVTSWDELPGSSRGPLDHEAALERAGYMVK